MPWFCSDRAGCLALLPHLEFYMSFWPLALMQQAPPATLSIVKQARDSVGASLADRALTKRPRTNQFFHRLSGGRANQLLQLAFFVHLQHDVGAADEFALDVELRNGRPVAVALDAFADFGIFEHVDGFQALGVHPARLENLHRAPGKTALRKAGRAFHEQQDVVLLDQVVNALMGVAHLNARETPAFMPGR